jgi:hypothetical protein
LCDFVVHPFTRHAATFLSRLYFANTTNPPVGFRFRINRSIANAVKSPAG